MKYLLHIAFDGLCFKGTQKQTDYRTVQGELEKILSSIYDSSISLECCSRLDSDVSAMDFVCAFTPKDNRVNKDKLPSVISKPFSGVLKVKSIEEVSDDFSPRFDAHEKTYLYLINLNGEPLFQSHSYEPTKIINIDKYKEALHQFLGIHDFKLFSSKDDRKDESETFMSSINKIDVEERNGLLLTFITGTNFHRYQIRFMIGEALDIASGKKDIKDLIDKLNGKGDPSTPRLKVPGKGLILYKVSYSSYNKDEKRNVR